MSKVSTVEARERFSDIINRAAFGKERVVLTRRGKELAAVVPIEDMRLLEELENYMDVEAARQALKEEGTIPWEQVKAELGL
ncbi:MAG: type II toxin-antitoxin system Phd/YefM family antitoxin [Pseudomonadota bacterium]|jgi:prevent-host-death family protein